jgi:hypothetical protein
MDAAGVLFHLPACLYRAVRDLGDDSIYDMRESVFFLLTVLNEYNRGRLAILNGEQRECVRECLGFFRDVLESHAKELALAIDTYWSQSAGA